MSDELFVFNAFSKVETGAVQDNGKTLYHLMLTPREGVPTSTVIRAAHKATKIFDTFSHVNFEINGISISAKKGDSKNAIWTQYKLGMAKNLSL